MLALMTLGADQATSLLMMLSVHVLSQIMDYALGGVALAVFFITSATSVEPAKIRAGHKPRFSWYTALAVLLFLCGVVFAGKELRAIRKLGSLLPPAQGHGVIPAGGQEVQEQKQLAGLHGFVVWSSNRSGNHDIWMTTLPDRQLKQLTTLMPSIFLGSLRMAPG